MTYDNKLYLTYTFFFQMNMLGMSQLLIQQKNLKLKLKTW